MRLSETLVNVTAMACGLAVLSFLSMLVAVFEFLGVLITGVVVLLISYNVELEDGLAIGHSQAPGVFAMQFGPKTADEIAAGRVTRGERLSILKISKLVGAALVTIGALGFHFFQL